MADLQIPPVSYGPDLELDAIRQGKPSGIETTLAERGSRYGVFLGHGHIAQELKTCIRFHLVARDKKLQYDQQEALDMICHKIARIINGDPDYADSWHDIAGYATLVENRLNGKPNP